MPDSLMEQGKKAYLILIDDEGKGHTMTANLSDAEISAYKAHPETFFNQITPVSKNVEHPIDLYEFFLNNHTDTSREKLLEFMSKSPDIEQLRKLSNKELLYTYAERLTHSAMQRTKKAEMKLR